MSSFTNIGLMLSMLSAAMLTAGCPGGSKVEKKEPVTKEELWVAHFKKDLAKSEQNFFQARYIQNQQDPFYLKDILPKLSADQPPTKALKAQIDNHRDDFEESWPLLTAQLSRTQLIFAVTAVLPAYNATMVLLSLNNSIDAENAASIVAFKELVLKGTVFNGIDEQLDLAPEARGDVVALANKIAVRTLALLSIAQRTASGAVQSQLSILKNEIRLLNPAAAESAGQGLTPEDIPYAESPLKLWSQLKSVYDRLFGVLSDMTRLGSLSQDLAKSSSRREIKTLKSEIASLSSDVKVKIDGISPLRAKETELLNKLVFATEKQFSLAKALTKAE